MNLCTEPSCGLAELLMVELSEMFCLKESNLSMGGLLVVLLLLPLLVI